MVIRENCWARLSSVFTTLVFVLFFSGCGGGTVPILSDYSSFETDFDGWTTNGMDLLNPTVDWSITRSQDRARDGSTSVKLYLNNLNDAGKIWIEKTYSVQQNRNYLVKVTYSFATQDWGNVNFWTIITGALPGHPQVMQDLGPAFQGDTSSGSTGPADFVWLDKSYTLSTRTDSTATIHVVIGIWGTYEVARTYYVDNVRVDIAEI